MADLPPLSDSIASNYPRADYDGLVYRRPPGVYWDAISIGYSMSRAESGTYITVVLLSGLISLPFFIGNFVISGDTFHVWISEPAKIGYSFLFSCVANLLYFGVIAVGVRHVQGYKPQLKDLFIPLKRPKIAAVATLLLCIPELVLSIASEVVMHPGAIGTPARSAMLILGGFLFYLLFNVFFYVPLTISGTAALFSGRSPIQTAKEIYSRLGGKIFMLGLLMSIAGLIAGLGALLCGIGLLFTYPIATNVFALHYFYFFPEDQLPRETPGAV